MSGVRGQGSAGREDVGGRRLLGTRHRNEEENTYLLVPTGYSALSRLPARHREPLRRGGRGKPLPQKKLLGTRPPKRLPLAGTEARPTAQRPALPKQQGLEQILFFYSMPYALCPLPTGYWLLSLSRLESRSHRNCFWRAQRPTLPKQQGLRQI